MQAALELAGGENGVSFLSVVLHNEAFHRMSQSLILIDALSSAFWEKETKKKK
jgi:hypothetical protein